jgi:hypothetical protein
MFYDHGPEPLFDKKEYLSLLRKTPKQELVNLAAMIATYEALSTQVEDLSQMVGSIAEKTAPLSRYKRPDLLAVRLHPDFVGMGRFNIAFSRHVLIDDEEKDAVVIIPQPSPDFSDKSRLNQRAITLSKTKGLAGFEQGIAVSYDPAVLVTERAPGKTVEQLSGPERRAISPERWQALLESVQALNGRVGFDTNPDNYLYDPAQGFTIIDLGNSRYAKDKQNKNNLSMVEGLRWKYSA